MYMYVYISATVPPARVWRVWAHFFQSIDIGIVIDSSLRGQTSPCQNPCGDQKRTKKQTPFLDPHLAPLGGMLEPTWLQLGRLRPSKVEVSLQRGAKITKPDFSA